MDYWALNRGVILGFILLLASCEKQGGSSYQNPSPRLDASADGAGAAPFLPQDGTRIKVRWVEAASGKRNPDSYVDTKLHVNCGFRRAMDGELRCLPHGFSLASHFADPNCATPAIVVGHAECNPPEFILRSDNSNSCMTRERVYRRGKKIPTVYIRTYPTGMPSECNQSPQFATSAAFELGEELPVGDFVKAGNVAPPKTDTSAPIELIIRTAEDGFRGLVSYQNMATETECNNYPTNQVDHFYCFPPVARIPENSYSDEGCQKPSAYFIPACEAQPTLAIQAIPKTCPTQYQLYSMGPRVTKLFSTTEGVCGAITATAGRQYHSDLQVASPSPYPILEFQIEDYPGARLLRRTGGSVPGPRAVTSVWYDTLRKEGCTPAQSISGKTRCFPSPSTFQGYFADATCTRPLWRTGVDLCTPNYVHRWNYSTCPASLELYKVGSTYTQAVYVLVNNKYGDSLETECELREKTVAGESFQTLTAIPETEFAELTLHSPI